MTRDETGVALQNLVKDTEAALKLSRRVIADFAAAAIDMTQHKVMNTNGAISV